jgi:predicted Zn-dependent protease
VDLFTTLKNSGGSKNPEWLSDHPADAKRIEHVENRIKADKRAWPPLTPLNIKPDDSKTKDQDKSGGGL